MRTTPDNVTRLEDNEVFVFGSNRAGRHGKGAALLAKRLFGAQYGTGDGPTGKCYAIATKSAEMKVLPLNLIASQVDTFLGYAAENPEKTFLVTQIGCGLAGYAPSEIAPMFKERTPNVILPSVFHLCL